MVDPDAVKILASEVLACAFFLFAFSFPLFFCLFFFLAYCFLLAGYLQGFILVGKVWGKSFGILGLDERKSW